MKNSLILVSFSNRMLVMNELYMTTSFSPVADKMRAASVSEAAITAFERSFSLLAANESGMIPESAIRPARDIPLYEDVAREPAGSELLAKAVMLKLNGGLGTGMGLDKAKSLFLFATDRLFLI